MRSLFLALALAIGLTACGGGSVIPGVPDQVVQGGILACNTYQMSLNQLAPRRRAGTLTAEQIAAVNRVEPTITTICVTFGRTGQLAAGDASTVISAGIELARIATGGR